jgi:hypothetical protein
MWRYWSLREMVEENWDYGLSFLLGFQAVSFHFSWRKKIIFNDFMHEMQDCPWFSYDLDISSLSHWFHAFKSWQNDHLRLCHRRSSISPMGQINKGSLEAQKSENKYAQGMFLRLAIWPGNDRHTIAIGEKFDRRSVPNLEWSFRLKSIITFLDYIWMRFEIITNWQ